MICHFQEFLECQILIFYMQCYLFTKCSFKNDDFVHQTFMRIQLIHKHNLLDMLTNHK